MKRAQSCGIDAIRIATHVTEADVSEQHIKAAKQLGLFTVGFLMMGHMAPVEKIVEEGKKMEAYGADVVYCTDSAGHLFPTVSKTGSGFGKKPVHPHRSSFP